MATTFLSQDLVHAIACATSSPSDPPDETLVRAMSLVCRSWRIVLLPVVFKTLRISNGNERTCLDFLNTMGGMAIGLVVRILELKTDLETLSPLFVGFFVRFPRLRSVKLHVTSFGMSTFAAFKQSIENQPYGLLSIDEVEINLASKLTHTSYSKLVSFLNLFKWIEDLRICRDRDLYEPEEPILLKHGSGFPFQLGAYPDTEDVIPRVAVFTLYLSDMEPWSHPGETASVLTNAFRFGQISMLRVLVVCSLTWRLEAFEVLGDFLVEGGKSLMSVNFSVWNSSAEGADPFINAELWNDSWRRWQIQVPKLECCVALENLGLDLRFERHEKFWELQYSSWSRALSLITHATSTLHMLDLTLLGHLDVFEVIFKAAEMQTPFAHVLTRFPGLQSIKFTLVLEMQLVNSYRGLLEIAECVKDSIRAALPAAAKQGILNIDCSFVC